MEAKVARIQPAPQPQPRRSAKPYDARFRRLIGSEEWAKLPKEVQRRFSKRIEDQRVAVYAGVIREARFSRAGWLLAQLARLVGAPLPLERESPLPAVVSVSEDRKSGGQVWTRIYGRNRGFPQVINSAKSFAGPTGLEEHIGGGIAMALRVRRVEGGLEFVSDHYCLHLFGQRLRLPRWMNPGKTVVRHIDQGEGRFIFSLQLSHPWFGEMVYQEGLFADG